MEEGNPLPPFAKWSSRITGYFTPTHATLSLCRGLSLQFTWWATRLMLQGTIQKLCSIWAPPHSKSQTLPGTCWTPQSSTGEPSVKHLVKRKICLIQRAPDVAPGTTEEWSQHQPHETLDVWTHLYFSDTPPLLPVGETCGVHAGGTER